MQRLILVNPWIYDFAAYDLWAKPLGLLYIAGYLRKCGFDVNLIDCLDVYEPEMENTGLKKPKRRAYGTGKFYKQMIETPSKLKAIKRPYSRYGMTFEIFEKKLRSLPKPSAFLVTSVMTYWYPGVKEAIRIIKKIYPDIPVLLGGIYVRLCFEHAKTCGADILVDSSDPEEILGYLEKAGISIPEKKRFDPSCIYPAFDLYRRIDYVCIMTSRGCPYRCSYCASPFLNPKFCRRSPEDVFNEILFWHKRYGIRDFAFYDDALLLSADSYIKPLLEMIIKEGLNVRFHTPNAIHIKGIDRELSELMYKAGFKTIRLGLETIDMDLHKRLDRKLSSIEEFEKAVNFLFKAGFRSNQIGAYILVGLPGQEISSVVRTIEFVGRMKVFPFLAEYSPIPHTALWDEAVRCSEFDLSEPLFHNNILLPCWDEEKRKEYPKLKKMALEIRKDLW